jgi:hypothetical protein
MRAFVDSKGTINIMYRSASDGNRDVYLLFGKEGGKGFVGGVLHPWKVSMCPMSTMGISEGTDLVATTWETDGKIYLSKIRLGLPTSAPIGMPGTAKGRKFSSVVVNNKGEMLVVWAEGVGWNKGGNLVWQAFDNKGKPTEDKGRIAGRCTDLGGADSCYN